MKIKCYNIEWNTNENEQALEKLPKEVMVDLKNYDEDVDLDVQLATELEKEFGYIVLMLEY